MYAWETIQKTLDYIEAHLGEELPTESLARQAALSPFYFQRLFSKLAGRPVQEYIRLRRLARASEALKAEPDRRILDIALDFGFGSHESFSRAFREAYGLTPDAWRSSGQMLNHFDKPDLLLRYIVVDEGVPVVSDGLVLEMNRRTLAEPVFFMGITGFIPIAGQMPLGKATGPDLPGNVWERFHQEKSRIPRIPDGREAGVAYFGDAPAGHFTYFAGAEVEAGLPSDTFVTWELPAQDYIVCSFEAESREELVTTALNKAVQYAGKWMQDHDLLQDAYSPELYYDSSGSGRYMELWIPAYPKSETSEDR